MPQVGERRFGATETVEWNGSRWTPVDAAPAAAPEQDGALSRFFGGAASTSPLNPMNWVRAAQDIPGTVGHMVVDPLVNLFKGVQDVKHAVTGEEGDRLLPAVRAVEHFGGAVPLIGPAAINAGEKMGNGDIAGGAGELAGLASGALMPKIAEKAPAAMKTVGGAVERGGKALQTKGVNTPMGTITPGGVGLVHAIMNLNPTTAAIAATPYALEYGGKATRMAGEALDGLRASRVPKAGPRPWQQESGAWDPEGPSRAARAKAEQARGYAEAKMDQDFRDARAEMDAESPTVPDMQGQSQTYGRGGYPGMGAKAAEMGDATLDSLRRGGYDVNPNGIRTQADLDKVAAGPVRNPAFMRFALDESATPAPKPSPEEAIRVLKGLPSGQYDMPESSLPVSKALNPSPVRGELPPARYIEAGPSSLEGQKALPPADYGSLDPDMDADFEYEAGDADKPGLTIDATPAGTRAASHQSALKALMNLDSFRRLR